jgi:hypothetical protein
MIVEVPIGEMTGVMIEGMKLDLNVATLALLRVGARLDVSIGLSLVSGRARGIMAGRGKGRGRRRRMCRLGRRA